MHGQMHSSIYLSIFNRLRAIARWSEIATFSYTLAFNAPVGVFPLEFREKFGPQKTRIMGLPGSEDSLTIGWAVSTQYQRDIQTDRQTDVQPIPITCAVWLTHVKNLWRTTFGHLSRLQCRTMTLVMGSLEVASRHFAVLVLRVTVFVCWSRLWPSLSRSLSWSCP